MTNFLKTYYGWRIVDINRRVNDLVNNTNTNSKYKAELERIYEEGSSDYISLIKKLEKLILRDSLEIISLEERRQKLELRLAIS